MPPSIENPFAPKVSLDPNDKKFVEHFGDPGDSDLFDSRQAELEPEWTGDIDLSQEEREQKENIEKERLWTRDRMIKWAESFGQNEDWIESEFTFDENEILVKEIEGDLYLSDNHISDITPLAGMKIGGSLWLSFNHISDLTPLAGMKIKGNLGLHNNHITDLTPLVGMEIKGSLLLGNNPELKSIPAGIGLKGSLYLSSDQTELIEDAKKKGYNVEIVK
jgi:hypothetical protein